MSTPTSSSTLAGKREYLENLDDRQLLDHLRGLRRLESKWGRYYQSEATFKNLRAEIDLAKEILATRGHIPNKQERKTARQKKARNGRHAYLRNKHRVRRRRNRGGTI